MSFYRDRLEEWLAKIDVNANRVLDLGGASNPVNTPKRLKSFKAKEYIVFDMGTEPNKVEYILFDINEPLEQLENPEKYESDVIFCLELFEYVWSPIEAVRNIYRLLKPGGIAYISFPSIYPVHNPVEIDYLRYTRNAIEKYLSINNLRILEVIPRVAKTGADALCEFYVRERMHPLKESEIPYHIGYLFKVGKAK